MNSTSKMNQKQRVAADELCNTLKQVISGRNGDIFAEVIGAMLERMQASQAENYRKLWGVTLFYNLPPHRDQLWGFVGENPDGDGEMECLATWGNAPRPLF